MIPRARDAFLPARRARDAAANRTDRTDVPPAFKLKLQCVDSRGIATRQHADHARD
jgi:hypothetical protein